MKILCSEPHDGKMSIDITDNHAYNMYHEIPFIIHKGGNDALSIKEMSIIHSLFVGIMRQDKILVLEVDINRRQHLYNDGKKAGYYEYVVTFKQPDRENYICSDDFLREEFQEKWLETEKKRKEVGA